MTALADEDGMTMTLSSTKLLVAASIFVVSFTSTLLPLKLIKVNENMFSAGNLLASGILLAAALVHQLPNAIDNLDRQGDLDHSSGQEQKLPSSSSFPIALFLCGLTFVVFLVLEEALHTHCDNFIYISNINRTNSSYHDDDEDDDDIDLTIFDGGEKEESTVTVETIYTTTTVSSPGSTEDRQDFSGGRGLKPATTTPLLMQAIQRKATTSINDGTVRRSSSKTKCCYHGPTTPLTTGYRTIIVPNGHVADEGDDSNANHQQHQEQQQHHGRHHHHAEHLAEHMNGSLVASLMLMLALSLHSIMESLAIGISTDRTDVASTTIAIIAHKGFAGYALGSSCVASQMNGRHLLVLSFVFACCSVIGIFIGIIFLMFWTETENDDIDDCVAGSDSNTTVGIIQAMVSGTFLYVSIVEIGMKELLICRDTKLNTCKKEIVWSKLTAFLVGYIAFSVLAIWV